MMKINIPVGDTASWENWGKLVTDWINNPGNRPNTLAQLNTQLDNSGVARATPIPGNPDRQVNVQEYADSGDPQAPPADYATLPPLQIAVPAKTALDRNAGVVPTIPAELPAFYDTIFSAGPRRNLTPAEQQTFALQRLGEYTINECSG